MFVPLQSLPQSAGAVNHHREQYNFAALMNFPAARSTMLSLPLKLNERTLAKATQLLKNELSFNAPESPTAASQIYAALAIAAEIEAVATAQPKSSSSQLTIEKIMAVLDMDAASLLVDCLTRMIVRLPQLPSHLHTKVSQLQLHYRLYCKFQRTVEHAVVN